MNRLQYFEKDVAPLAERNRELLLAAVALTGYPEPQNVGWRDFGEFGTSRCALADTERANGKGMFDRQLSATLQFRRYSSPGQIVKTRYNFLTATVDYLPERTDSEATVSRSLRGVGRLAMSTFSIPYNTRNRHVSSFDPRDWLVYPIAYGFDQLIPSFFWSARARENYDRHIERVTRRLDDFEAALTS
jgi:hypothetical protein